MSKSLKPRFPLIGRRAETTKTMRCSFAKWNPVSYFNGAYVGGPFRIIHHTTEGSSAAGALSIFKIHYAPHFVVDKTTIYQLLDTTIAASSVRNSPGGVETNRWSAIQIEIVGFAGKPKDMATLKLTRELCRWIESVHDIPRVWPAGFPRFSTNGNDPGGHNRDPHIWTTQGGHYGHSQVPENIHWDPAYTYDEVEFLMSVDSPVLMSLTSPARRPRLASKKKSIEPLCPA